MSASLWSRDLGSEREKCKPWPRRLGQTVNEGMGKLWILQKRESGTRVKKDVFKKVTFEQETWCKKGITTLEVYTPILLEGRFFGMKFSKLKKRMEL